MDAQAGATGDTPHDAFIGTTVDGRYRILALIGQGGFGAVYKAQHVKTQDIVALKVLRATGDRAEMMARFEREATATSSLKHPNTVRVFDFGDLENGNLYLAMEFLDGKPLSSLLQSDKALEWRRLVRIAVQVLKSLSEAHSRGLVHRDLKPDNIFLQRVHGEPEFVKVLDFGIAKSMLGAQGNLTSTGVIIGTPHYMSPEQARGDTIDGRCDLYALGVILYEGMSGTSPFPGATPIETLIKRLTQDPPPLADRLTAPCPAELCEAVHKAIARSLSDRFANPDAMAQRLTEILEAHADPTVRRTTSGMLPASGSGMPGSAQVDVAASNEWNASTVASTGARLGLPPEEPLRTEVRAPVSVPPAEPTAAATQAGRASQWMPAAPSGPAPQATQVGRASLEFGLFAARLQQHRHRRPDQDDAGARRAQAGRPLPRRRRINGGDGGGGGRDGHGNFCPGRRFGLHARSRVADFVQMDLGPTPTFVIFWRQL